MRGAGDLMTVGEGIAFYRARRGYTQTQLANLVGRRTDWLSKIERGERQLRNVHLLTGVARVLRVTLLDLLGQPVLMENDQERDAIPAIRDVLMSPDRLSRVLFRALDLDTVPNLAQSTRLVEYLWSDFQSGKVGNVIRNLPKLIRTAQQLEDGAASHGRSRPERITLLRRRSARSVRQTYRGSLLSVR